MAKESGCGSGCLLLLGIPLAMFMALLISSASMSSRDTTTGGERQAALQFAKARARTALKLPHTASWPWDSIRSSKVSQHEWTVTGEVYSQNVLGVELRNSWVANVQLVDDRFKLKSIRFGD